MKLLNIGCGTRFHPDWVNLDVVPAHQSVTQCDVHKGIPYPDNFFDLVYHSHVLEHFEKFKAPLFINECYRVLRPGGILRVVVPDLEEIARLYLEALTKSVNGEQCWQDNYEWIMLEMYDQTVRTHSGGDMLAFLTRDDLPGREFVLQRGGAEIKNIIETKKESVETGQNKSHAVGKQNKSVAGFMKDPRAYLAKKKEHLVRYLLGSEYAVLQEGRFRQRGEIHLWMYDRFSLGKVLQNAGFSTPEAKSAAESALSGWSNYNLDTEPDGSAYKPGSLYMEALKTLE